MKVFFAMLAWEGSTLKGIVGGAQYKNNSKTSAIGVDSGVMKVAEFNYDIHDAGYGVIHS